MSASIRDRPDRENTMDTIEIGTAVSNAAGVVKGFLKVGELPDGQAMRIPVVIVRGEASGPLLWLHGCVHGNEYCGTFTIHELIRGLAPSELKGTVVALPILNITAFEKSQRMSPFELYGGGDLNWRTPSIRCSGSMPIT
jgi:uncharacterized protein